MKKHKITLGGRLGSGKSSTVKIVASSLGYPHYSGGDFMREMAKQKGITLRELGAMAQTDPNVDKEIDNFQKNFMETNDSFIVDSRLGWYLAPDSFKVFLNLDPRVAAERVLKDMKENESRSTSETTIIPETVEEMMQSLESRLESERQRYQKYYGILDHQDLSHFDLVIDTGVHDLQTVSQMIIDEYQKWLNS